METMISIPAWLFALSVGGNVFILFVAVRLLYRLMQVHQISIQNIRVDIQEFYQTINTPDSIVSGQPTLRPDTIHEQQLADMEREVKKRLAYAETLIKNAATLYVPDGPAPHLAVERRGQTAATGFSQWVYLIYCPTGHYKIGVAKNPGQRLASLKTLMPVELEVLHLIGCDNAYSAEEDLHKLFSDRRYRGEWFVLSPEDIDYIYTLRCYKNQTFAA